MYKRQVDQGYQKSPDSFRTESEHLPEFFLPKIGVVLRHVDSSKHRRFKSSLAYSSHSGTGWYAVAWRCLIRETCCQNKQREIPDFAEKIAVPTQFLEIGLSDTKTNWTNEIYAEPKVIFSIYLMWFNLVVDWVRVAGCLVHPATFFNALTFNEP